MSDDDRDRLEPMEKNYTPRHDDGRNGSYEPRTPGETNEQRPAPPPSKDD